MINTAPGSPNASNYLYPLSSMTAIAHRAYSFRRLRSAYTGPLVQLRRDSDNALADVSASNYEFISGDSLVSSGGNLTTWAGSANLFIKIIYDQSPLGINAQQATSSAQPQFILNGGAEINNKPVIRQSGIQYMTVASPINAPTSLSMALVQGNITNRTILNRIFGTVRTTDNLQLFNVSNNSTESLRSTYYQAGGTSILDLNGGPVLGANFTQWLVNVTQAALVSGTINEKGVQYVNGTSSSAWSNAQTNTEYQFLGMARVNAYYIGDFCEFIMFTSSLSAADQKIVTVSQRGFYNT